MNGHPDPNELEAFRARRLAPAAVLRIDRHLTGCDACRAALAGRGAAARGARVLSHVIASGSHLGFDQLEAYVDRRVDDAQRAVVDAHTALCPMCRRELHELTRAAAALGHRVDKVPQTAGWRRWFSASGFVPGLATAVVLGAVVLGSVLERRPTSSTPGADGLDTMRVGTPPSIDSQLDHGALDELAGMSTPAAAAYRAGDYAALVLELRPLVERRQPVAMAALASLYARGLGVERDMRQAEQLWQRAAELGHVPSRANVDVLRRDAAKR